MKPADEAVDAGEVQVESDIRVSRLILFGHELHAEVVPGLREKRLAKEGLVSVRGHQMRVAEYSLFFVHIQSRIRTWMLWLVTWTWFDRVILLAILTVSVLMATEDHRNTNSPMNAVIAAADPYFFAIFVAEATAKIVAYGFIRHYASYLRDPFNILDFTVVLGGVLELMLGAVVNLRFLRVIRTLRPLRSMNIIKDMKLLVSAMIGSVPKLGDVGQAGLSFVALYAILGLQLFGGVFHRRCRTIASPIFLPQDVCWSWPLDAAQSDQICGGRYVCHGDTFCGSNYSDDSQYGPTFETADITWCGDSLVDLRSSESSNFGITSFDNFGAAFLTVFQCLSLEGWTDIMYMVQDGFNDYVGTVYFFLIVLLGAFFIWNLALAVVWDTFQELHEKLVKRRAKRQVGSDAGSSLSSLSSSQVSNGSTLTRWVARPLNDLWLRWKMSDKTSQEKRLVRRIAKMIVDSKIFSIFVMMCIVCNIIIMCIDRYPPPPYKTRRVMETMNGVFTYVYLLEMILTLIAIGLPGYLANASHVFDGILVTLSVVEMVSSSSGSGAIVFRGLRLFRLFKLAKNWRSLRVLLKAMLTTAKSMYIFVLLLGLALFTFALMGMSFFGGDLGDPIPRSNFDYFIRALATVFQLMTGENWNSVWYSCYLEKGWTVTIYFFAVTLILRFLVINLFMAILMDRFQQNRDSSPKSRTKKTLAPTNTKNAVSVFNGLVFNAAAGTLAAGPSSEEGRSMGSQSFSESKQSPIASNSDDITQRCLEEQRTFKQTPIWPTHYSLLIFPSGGRIRKGVSEFLLWKWANRFFLFLIIFSSVTLALDNPLQDPRSSLAKFLATANQIVSGLFISEMVAKWIAVGFAAYWKRGWNKLDGFVSLLSVSDFVPGGGSISALKTFRVFRVLRPLRLIARNKNLQVVIGTLIKLIPELGNLLLIGAMIFLMFGLFLMNFLKGGFSSCRIAQDGNLVDFPVNLNFSVTSLCLDINSGILTKQSPDGCSTVSSVVEYARRAEDVPICIVDEPSTLSMLDYPSVCSTNPASPLLLDSFVRATSMKLMPCGTVAVSSGTSVAVAGCAERLCGDNVTSSKDYCAVECSDNADMFFMCHNSCPGDHCEECRRQCEAACQCDKCVPFSLDAAQCVEQGGAWVDFDMPVNNVGLSVMTLFMTASTEGWVEVMNRAVDSRGVMKQPIRDLNEVGWILFFLLFMVVCSLFILNLCIGLVVEKFNKLKASGGNGSALLTEAQRRWLYVTRVLGNQRKFSVLNKIKQLPQWRKRLFFFTASSVFEAVISVCIILNAVVMAMATFPNPSYAAGLVIANIVFTLVFLTEMAMKIAAIGKSYFADAWNRFDCFCVIAGIIGISLEIWGGASIGGLIGVVRLLRLARLLRLVRKLKGLNRVFAAFFMSIPKLLNVGILVVLMLFMYSVLGVQLFAETFRYGSVNEHANFGTIYRSLVSLFRFMTGETWTYFTVNLMADPFFLSRVMKTPCLADFSATEDTFDSLQARCLLDNPVKCGNAIAATLFFVSFVVLFSFAILNLFVAVVLEGFDDAKSNNDDEVIDSCVERWQDFDPQLQMETSIEQAVLFLETVASQVMRENKKTRETFQKKRIERAAQLRTPIFSLVTLDFARRAKLKVSHQRTVRFMDALESALRVLVDAPAENNEEPASPNDFTLFDHVAAAKIQLRLRIKQMKSRQVEETRTANSKC